MKKLLTILSILFFSANSFAQDLHFSQFFNSPLSTNPANTGFIPDADYRLGVQYRNQWSTVMEIPYKTMSAFADAQIFRDKLENGWVGIGGLLMSDVAGTGSMRSNKFYGSVAYHHMLGLGSLLSAGFNFGYASKRIDFSRLKFPDQFDGKFFDANIPTSAIPTNSNVNYFDVQAGLNYAYFPDENTYINVGYSIHHLNRPRESFFNDKSSTGIIPLRQIAFANAILRVGDRVILSPNIYYTNQHRASELTAGATVNYNLSESGEQQFIAGIYMRSKESFIPTAGFVLYNTKIMFSYDATISTMKNFNQSRGALEFSLIKSGNYNSGTPRDAICPKF